jgi:hypothetical protein
MLRFLRLDGGFTRDPADRRATRLAFNGGAPGPLGAGTRMGSPGAARIRRSESRKTLCPNGLATPSIFCSKSSSRGSIRESA